VPLRKVPSAPAAGGREARMRRVVLTIALVTSPLFGDEVYLKGGGQISGAIVERSDESVTVDIGGGTLTVQMSQVVRIESSVSPVQEFKQRAAGLPADDARAWRELAQWAESRALATQAREAWTRVAAILPDDPEANEALGRVYLDGAWVSEEESYRARGFVEFEGEWMTPGERQAILAERRAQEEADRQALAAQIQADQEAAAAQEAQEQAEHDEFWQDNLPQMGDPLYWGWGAGPAYWPYVPAQPVRPSRPATLPARGGR